MALEVPGDRLWDEGEILALCVFRRQRALQTEMEEHGGGDGGF